MINEVSNETLLEDIRNTEKELKAYVVIAGGFYDLMQLPENTGSALSRLGFEYEKYSSAENECRQFLAKLNRLADERGLF